MPEDRERWVMSVALLVRLKHSLPLNEVGPAASLALRELLNLDRDPVVSARFDPDRRGGELTGLVTENSSRVICALSGYEERVRIMPFVVPVQIPTSDGSYSFTDQSYLSIDWLFNKTPLCWALVAAAAVGTARKLGSEVEDNASFFSNIITQDPDDFCRSLKIPTQQVKVEVAAEMLYAKMPKSAEIVGKPGREGQTEPTH
jgi:hypothetical protein